MLKYLPFAALTSAAFCQAHAAGPPGAGIQQVSVQKPAVAPATPPRQLSADQRAELRRQITQFSRLPGKGS